MGALWVLMVGALWGSVGALWGLMVSALWVLMMGTLWVPTECPMGAHCAPYGC